MRGWSSIVVGFLLLGVGYLWFAMGGLGSSIFCVGAAAFFFFRGAQGLTANEAGDVGDASAVIEFVSNPAEAIVDTATDRLADWFKGDEPKPVAPEPATAESSGFDPDAIVARYLAQRGPEPAGAAAAQAPPRGFGRKGL